MQDDLVHVGRRQRLGDELTRIVGPGHDVDALAAQLADHGLDPAALEADASADGIHVRIPRPDGDLRAASRLARDGPDLDDAR